MPLDAEDSTAGITGDPTPVAITPPAGMGKPTAMDSPAPVDAAPKPAPPVEKDVPATSSSGPATPPPADPNAPSVDEQPAAQAPDTGIMAPTEGATPTESSKEAGPNFAAAAKALQDGMGTISKDPQWMTHPLLRLFADPTGDPEQIKQDVWGAAQWWGRAVNSAINPDAIHESAVNIEHDNSIQGKIAQAVFDIHNDPLSHAAWNIAPYALQMAAELPGFMWAPSMAAQGPGDVNNIPASLGAIVGGDLRSPKFQDPEWYARMGGYVVAAAIAAKAGGEAASPILSYSRTIPGLDRFAATADRLLGGKAGGDRLPIKMPDGQTISPTDEENYKFGSWLTRGLDHVQEGTSPIGKAPLKAGPDVLAKASGEGDAASYVASSSTAKPDAKALKDLSDTLGAKSTDPAELKNHLWLMAENRELTPAMSQKILDGWDKYGRALGVPDRMTYYHPEEAPLRDPMVAAGNLTNSDHKAAAQQVISAMHGLVSDAHQGIHSYGNDLVEAMTKGIMASGRSTDHYADQFTTGLEKLFKGDAAGRQQAFDAIESPEKYADLQPHQQFAVDAARRMLGELRVESKANKFEMGEQPNFIWRSKEANPRLEKALSDVPDSVRNQVRGAITKGPVTSVRQGDRAVQLVGDGSGGVRAESAYKTTAESNMALSRWQGQVRANLMNEAEHNPELKAVISDPKKLTALIQAEVPLFSRDLVDVFKGNLAKQTKALTTHKAVETAKRTLVQDIDGRWHPLAVNVGADGTESVDKEMQAHFRELHGAPSTKNFYQSAGYGKIAGVNGPTVFHPGLADPLNRVSALGTGTDAASKVARLANASGKRFILWNPLWHGTNMAGQFGRLAFSHPLDMIDTFAHAAGIKGGLSAEQRQLLWQQTEHEYFAHGGVAPHLNGDVSSEVQQHQVRATGDLDAGETLDGKVPLAGKFDKVPGLSGALGLVKGADHWWQSSINDHFWAQYHKFNILAYMALKKNALEHGMPPGDARLMAASQANAWGGMVSPDRWAFNPSLQKASSSLLLAPNWWRAFPRTILNSYDRLGMKTNPALSTAWAVNTAKTIGGLVAFKGATDNAMNYLASGHWQFQNQDGYKNSITMDNFFPPDPNSKTQAHYVMENPFVRQTSDLEKVGGLSQALDNNIGWKPGYMRAGASETAAGRQSPLLAMLEMAGNVDLQQTLKTGQIKYIDASHPNFFGSALSALTSPSQLSPAGFSIKNAIETVGLNPDGNVTRGPLAGTKVPSYLMRAFNPNDPQSSLMGLAGVRGGYPRSVKSDDPSGSSGLSTQQELALLKETNQHQDYLGKQQQGLATGGITPSDFAYNINQELAGHSNRTTGILGTGLPQDTGGAAGILAKYESFYSDPQAHDQYGDINMAYIRRQQDQLQAQVTKDDPATWRQAMALRNQTEYQFPALRVYKDSIQAYHDFQTQFAQKSNIDPEVLRDHLHQVAVATDYRATEQKYPELRAYQQAKRQWEMGGGSGMLYGMFTNSKYVMNFVNQHGGKGYETQVMDSAIDVAKQQNAKDIQEVPK